MTPKDSLRSDYLRVMAVEYGKHFIGTPYHFGGDDFSAFDCSGFVIEVLQGVGILPYGRDYSAHDLYAIFKSAAVATGYAGCLAFYLNPAGRAVHVMLMVDNGLVMGAAGGGSGTITTEDAITQNAFVKIRPLDYRKGPRVIIDPFKVTLP